MRVLCVIPARIGSSRLPQKPLQPLANQPLIEWVARRVAAWNLVDHLVVATDDGRVAEAARRADVESVITEPHHRSGSERISEIIELERFKRYDLVLNVQGDEPLLPRAAAEGAIAEVERGGDIGTAAATLSSSDWDNPHAVKAWVDARGWAVGFSRGAAWDGPAAQAHRHLGVYAYRPTTLRRWVTHPRTPDEIRWKLEQLRPLSYEARIGVRILGETAPPGIDTWADLRRVEHLLTTRENWVSA